MKRILVLMMVMVLTQLLSALPDKFVKELKLTADQTNKIEAIMQTNDVKREELKLKMQIEHLELKKMLFNDETNINKIRERLELIAKVEVELRLLFITQDIDILKILNDDQKTKYKSMRIKMKKMGPMDMEEGKGKGKLQGPGPDDNELGFLNPGENCGQNPGGCFKKIQ